MYSPNRYRGLILIDILVALALSSLFILLISDNSLEASSIFFHAKSRNKLLLDYIANQNLTTVSIKPYGDDRIEQNIFLTDKDSASSSILFTKVKELTASNIEDAAGTPICSVDYFNHSVVGSYEFLSYSISTSSIKITPISLPIDPLLPITDFQIRNGVAYISTDSTIVSDPDILVIDIKDISKPKLLSSINIGPGIQAIALAGNHLFGAATSASAQLHIIRIDSLDSLVLEKKFKLSLPFATATPAFGSSIFYNKGNIFLGTEKWDGEEFNIINVSNPSVPNKIGGLETNTKINDIWVQDNLAYLAGSDQGQLRLVDVSNPNKPVQINSFSPSGWNRQEGRAISLFENNLNFGRTSGGYNITNALEAFHFGTSSILNFSKYSGIDVSGGVYGIVSDRSHVYLATRQINKEFQIYDGEYSTSSTLAFSLPVAPQRMTCDGNYIYVLAGTAPVIYQISFK